MNEKRNLGMRVLFFLLLFFVISFHVESLLAASNGKIIGTVTDKASNLLLPGANCVLDGTSLGGSTDLNGEFIILNVAPGLYDLKVTYIGYNQEVVPVLIKPGATMNVDISLGTTVIDIEDVVVVTAQREGQVAAINQQLTADAIKNVVSSERIQEVPDANAAESVSRLPGISLIRNAGEGSNVVVRGLPPQYNRITVNGVTIPSTAENSRTTDMSMIASENLSGIEAFKALTPDMDGDAIGGIVNLQLAKAKDRTRRYVRVYGGYNSQEKDPKQYKASLNWSQRVFNKKLGIQGSLSSELRNRSADELSADYVLSQPKPDGTTPLRLTRATVTDREEYRKRFGASLIFDYEFKNWNLLLSNFYTMTNRDILNRSTEFNSSNMNTESHISNPERNIDLLTTILSGKGFIGKLEVDWSMSRSATQSKQDHNTTLEFLQDRSQIPIVDFETVQPTTFLKDIIPDSASSMSWAEHSLSIVKEKSYMAGINFKLPYQITQKISGELKFGVKYKANDRFKDTNEGEWWVHLDLANYPITDFLDPDYDPGKFLDGQSSIGIILDPRKSNEYFDLYESNFTLSDYNRDTYDVLDQVSATYLMTKLNIGQSITFIPGVRYEQFDGEYLGYFKYGTGHGTGIKIPKKEIIVHRDWLPMVHLRVKPTDWFDVRLAVTKSLVRPNFNHLLPNFDSSFESDNISQGNPDLNMTRSWNYDAYVSFYNNLIGLFTVGYFYKDMEGTVTNVRQYIEDEEKAASLGLPVYFYDDFTYINRLLTRPENMPPSVVKGFEIDWQTNFGYLPGFLKGFVFNINYARLQSSTTYPFFRVESVYDPTKFPPFQKAYINETRDGKLAGQAAHIVNWSLGYDIGGFSARISMNYQGESLRSAGSQAELDRWNESFTRWDFSVKQRLSEKLSLLMNGSNINNQYDGTYYALDPRPTSLSYYGPQYDLGIQFNF